MLMVGALPVFWEVVPFVWSIKSNFQCLVGGVDLTSSHVPIDLSV